MEISIKLKDDKEIRLKPLTFRQEPDIINFIPLSGGQFYLKIKLDGSKFEIINQHPDIDEIPEKLVSKIEEWLVESNPEERFGTEETETEDKEEETPYDPDTIRVDTKPFSLRQIYDMIKANDIDLSPDFQRHLVWDKQRKSRLIESILLRIPLPMFYFSQDEEGKITVVDGLQRLSTIREFMDNELRLKNLEYLEEKCGGKYYKPADKKNAINSKYFRWFNMTQITVNVIDPSSPFKLKYDIFRRINTGGKPLNSQEIRNCLSSDSLRKALRKMATLDSFKEATGHSVKDVRMEAQELALRYILFYRKYEQDKTLNNYSGNIDSELNSLTEELSKDKKYNYDIVINKFNNAMLNANHLFGRYAFRKCKTEHINPEAYRQLINKALFVSWSVLLSQFQHSVLKNRNKYESFAIPLALKVTNNNKLFNYLTYSTNSKVNVQESFKAADEIINSNLVK